MSCDHNPKHYLTVRLSALGDVILTTGVLAYWHAKYGFNFHVLTRPALAPILDNHPGVSEIITIEASELRGLSWLSFCRSLRHSHGHLPLIDLHKNLRTRILSLTWPSRTFSYAKHTLDRRLFLATRHPIFSERLNTTNVPQRYSLALETSAPDVSALRPIIYLTESEQQAATRRLHELGLKRPIAIHPYATHPAKSPDAATWRQVVRILESNGEHVIIIGRNAIPLFPDSAHDLTNATDLRLTAAILHQCRGLITGDSGPMHLATAVQTPVVALFGPTTREWGFYPSGPHDTIHQSSCSKAPCSLHGQHVCARSNTCMNSITAEQILFLARSIRA